jgi:hypothetical protein
MDDVMEVKPYARPPWLARSEVVIRKGEDQGRESSTNVPQRGRLEVGPPKRLRGHIHGSARNAGSSGWPGLCRLILIEPNQLGFVIRVTVGLSTP